MFAALCLITGSIWGRPTWGTWWEWDGRLTSMLLLFFVYIAWIALERADRERGGDGRIPALFGIAGTALLPVIRYSVVWWQTLHQGQSITLTQSSIHDSMLWPLLLTSSGFSLIGSRQDCGGWRHEPLAFHPRGLCRGDHRRRRAVAGELAGDAQRRACGRSAEGPQVKRKHQRLALGLAAFAAIGGASGLALSALKDQAAFFYTPSDVATKNPPVDKAVRLGGMVETGSIRHLPDGVTISFVVTDKEAKVPVRFTGVAPDLFKEGSGVVAEGRFHRRWRFRSGQPARQA
ncbi:ccmE domain-containing protein [Ditylenchus destructor]|uniref:CcmE domain-containing protein n=1 Tax=Ditylenchus destructor TaxID=166010 RepID=A0AAD4MDS0_9BILA|nr:ccmE domain-containing protein [Ditylenchus destructor]